MCGIYAVFSLEEDAASLIVEGLKRLEYRGYDSWGIGIIYAKDQVWVTKQVGAISQANNLSRMPSSCLGIGHTRWATHGGVTQANAHPHSDCANRWLLVHNGVIENATKLKADVGSGHLWRSETDTEVAAHLLETLALTALSLSRWRGIMQKLTGNNAVVALDVKTQTIYAYSQGSPLLIGRGKGILVIASDEGAMVGVNEVANLPKAGAVQINQTGLKVLGNINQLIWRPKLAGERLTESKSSRFSQEIKAQPQLLKQMVGAMKTAGPEIKRWQQLETKTLIGCGSAYHAALTAQYWNNSLQAVVASEFNRLRLKTEGLLAVSQSGETMDTMLAIRPAKAQGKPVWALVNNVHSSLASIADVVWPLSAGREEAVAASKSYTAMLAWLWWLSQGMMSDDAKQKVINRTATTTDRMVSQDPELAKVKRVAQKLKDCRHIYILGKGTGYPTALEIALKLKEVTYIHAEGVAGGEVKHGMLALIEKGTPVIVVETEPDGEGELLATEVAARGAWVLGIGANPYPAYQEWWPIPNSSLNEIPAVVWGQLLALELAKFKGINPDRPRNLAKSVTVK